MLTATILAYLIVGMQKPVYQSNAILSAGITIDKSIKVDENTGFVQEFEINSKFSNLMENMKSRTSLRLLSYRLLQHDLEYAGIDTVSLDGNLGPYRILTEEMELDVTAQEIISLRNFFKEVDFTGTLTQEYDAIYRKVAKAYGYDYESLGKKLNITRIGKTDYLKVEFESENPGLCEAAVRIFCKEFIAYNTRNSNSEEESSVKFFQAEVEKKKSRLDSLTKAIGVYRKKHNIIDIEAQSESVVSLIADLEKLRAEEGKDIGGKKRSIGNLNTYIDKTVTDGADDYSTDASVRNRYANVDEEIKSLSEKAINAKGDAKIQRQLEEKRQERTKLLQQMSTRKVLDGKKFGEKADKLEGARIETEGDLALAEEAVKSLDGEISRLKGRASGLVTAEQDIEVLSGEKEIALEEYLQAEKQLNAANLNFNSQKQTNPIDIFEYPQVPEKPAASNRAIISGFAGVAGLSLSTFFLFVIALFDGRISSPEYFERITKSPLLGYLNGIRVDQLDLEGLFEHATKDAKLNHFKEALRRIRYQLLNTGAKTVLITSTQAQAGKTFAVLSLAYSLSKNKKKVLIIDTNFKNNTLTGFANKEMANNPLYNGYLNTSGNTFFDEFSEAGNASSVTEKPEAAIESKLGGMPGPLSLLTVKKKKLKTSFILNGKVDIIGNIQSSHSPAEVLAGKDFKSVIANFEMEYDFIFLEGAALNDFSDTRELIQYSDKVIAVVDAQNAFGQVDKESIAFLNGLGDNKYMGAILNQVDLKNLG